MTRGQALLDVALALLLTLLAGIVVAMAAALVLERFALPPMLVMALQGVVILAGLHLLLAWRGRDWRDIGLTALQGRDLGRAALALLLVFLVNGLFTTLLEWLAPSVIEAHQEGLAGVAGALTRGLPLAAVAAIMLFVGLYEEMLARGFLLSRCRVLLGGVWGPVLLSSLLFGLGHMYQGWLGVVQTALIGVVFAHLVLRWGSLWPVILAHGALNTISVALIRSLS